VHFVFHIGNFGDCLGVQETPSRGTISKLSGCSQSIRLSLSSSVSRFSEIARLSPASGSFTSTTFKMAAEFSGREDYVRSGCSTRTRSPMRSSVRATAEVPLLVGSISFTMSARSSRDCMLFERVGADAKCRSLRSPSSVRRRVSRRAITGEVTTTMATGLRSLAIAKVCEN